MPNSCPLPNPEVTCDATTLHKACDVLVLAIQEDMTLGGLAAEYDRASGGTLSQLIKTEEFTGKTGQTLLMPGHSAGEAEMVLLVGLGKSPTRGDYFEMGSTATRSIAQRQRNRVVVGVDSVNPPNQDAVVAGVISGCEVQSLYKTETEFFAPKTFLFPGFTETAIHRGEHLGHSIILTKRLVNEPACQIYPESFADQASEMAKESGLDIEIWDEKKLGKENCRAILGVGQASPQPPRLVIFRYNGGGNEAPLAIVGKGVTFDSGGLSLKPSDAMADMKCDMAGAATVFGVMRAIAKIGVQQNVIGLCGLAENMVAGNSYKLGDVIETRSGKTIEILNTDAEGRVVLADTLDVAIGYKPRAIVDLATLTGACMVALGTEVAGLMTNHDELCDELVAAAQHEGEPVWQLPMFDLYDEKIKSKVADIKNIGEGRWGGAITAAKFLENFVGDVPWVHIDIAGPAFADSPKPHRDAGATGVMVRSLLQWIETAKT